VRQLLQARSGIYHPALYETTAHRAYPFRMTARDMARFGLLFLRGGKWNGTQVVPEAWVKESTTAWSDAGTSGGYGYLGWIAKSGLHFSGVTLPAGSEKTPASRRAGGTRPVSRRRSWRPGIQQRGDHRQDRGLL